MLWSKHQVLLVVGVISLTIPNSIQDSFNNTKAISRAKEINIVREAKIDHDRGDSKVSQKATILKMLPEEVTKKSSAEDARGENDSVRVPMVVWKKSAHKAKRANESANETKMWKERAEKPE